MRYIVRYHGTTRANVSSILAHGLQSRHYGINFNNGGEPYHILFKDKVNAALPGREVVIVFDVPAAQAADYLTCLNEYACGCKGWMAGLLQPLPPRMIRAVEDL